MATKQSARFLPSADMSAVLVKSREATNDADIEAPSRCHCAVVSKPKKYFSCGNGYDVLHRCPAHDVMSFLWKHFAVTLFWVMIS